MTLIWRRNLVLITVGISAFFSLLGTIISFTTVSEPQGPGPQPQTTLAQLEASDGIIHGLTGSMQFLGVIALVVFAASITSEYGHGTLRNLLVRQPRRMKLLAGRLLALCIFILTVAVACAIVAAIAALAIAPGQDIATSAWSFAGAATGTLQVAGAMIGFGLLGAFLGVLFRSSIAAISVGIAYLLPAEAILGGLWDGTKWILPGKLLSAVSSGGLDGVSLGAAAGLSGAFVLASLIASFAIFNARDVNS